MKRHSSFIYHYVIRELLGSVCRGIQAGKRNEIPNKGKVRTEKVLVLFQRIKQFKMIQKALYN